MAHDCFGLWSLKYFEGNHSDSLYEIGLGTSATFSILHSSFYHLQFSGFGEENKALDGLHLQRANLLASISLTRRGQLASDGSFLPVTKKSTIFFF